MKSFFSVLVIDDDEDDFIIIQDLIADIFSNYSLKWEPNPEIGIERLCNEQPDVCLLDINLGLQSGLQLLKEAKARGYNNPIIMLTGRDDIEADREASRSGAADFLVKKDLNASRIWRSIRYALASREATNERIERVRAQAESKAKSRFLANLSHEIRSPLTSILGYSELLLQKEYNDETGEKIAIIHRNGIHLLNLINDVLDLSKIEARKIDLSNSPINLERFLTSVYKSLKVTAESKKLLLDFKFDNVLPVIIKSDVTRLRQILINIINNAIKYTEEGSVTVSVGYERHAEAHHLTFSVKDTGIGIDEQKLKDIFEPFSQITPDGKTPEGAGLGLTISRELIYSMGGSLEVKSRLREGTTVDYFVKVELEPDVQFKNFNIIKIDGLALVEKNDITAGLLDKVKLLVVDDIDDVRAVIADYAQHMNIPCRFAKDGKEAIDILKSEPGFNAIFMDIQMPVMDGISAAGIIRKMHPDIYMCALTASSTNEQRQQAFAAGFDDFLSKPVSMVTFYRTLALHFGREENPVVQADTPVEEPKEQVEKISMQNARPALLLIDDNIDVLPVTASLLEHCGWSVTTAETCARALEHLQKDKSENAAFQLILMDLQMPDCTTTELLNGITGLASDVPIVILSGSEPDSNVFRFSQVKDYLLKPVTLADLKQKLAQFR